MLDVTTGYFTGSMYNDLDEEYWDVAGRYLNTENSKSKIFKNWLQEFTRTYRLNLNLISQKAPIDLKKVW